MKPQRVVWRNSTIAAAQVIADLLFLLFQMMRKLIVFFLLCAILRFGTVYKGNFVALRCALAGITGGGCRNRIFDSLPIQCMYKIGVLQVAATQLPAAIICLLVCFQPVKCFLRRVDLRAVAPPQNDLQWTLWFFDKQRYIKGRACIARRNGFVKTSTKQISIYGWLSGNAQMRHPAQNSWD